MRSKKDENWKKMCEYEITPARVKKEESWKEISLFLEKYYCERIRKLYIVQLRAFCTRTFIILLKPLTCSCHQRREKCIKFRLWKTNVVAVLKTKRLHALCSFSFRVRIDFQAVLCTKLGGGVVAPEGGGWPRRAEWPRAPGSQDIEPGHGPTRGRDPGAGQTPRSHLCRHALVPCKARWALVSAGPLLWVHSLRGGWAPG